MPDSKFEDMARRFENFSDELRQTSDPQARVRLLKQVSSDIHEISRYINHQLETVNRELGLPPSGDPATEAPASHGDGTEAGDNANAAEPAGGGSANHTPLAPKPLAKSKTA